jgi:hypothetical protein
MMAIMQLLALAAALALALPPLAAAALDPTNSGEDAIIYAQPEDAVDVPSHVFANPKPWPRASLTGHTASVFWQHGDVGGAALHTPTTGGSLEAWTGTAAAASEQAVAEGPAGIPWSGLQFTKDGVWGAALNTTGADPETEHLTTTTIESEWHGHDSAPATCIPAFADGGAVRVAFDLRVPHAFKLNHTANSCAVYISLSLYLRSMPLDASTSRFVWYSTNVFDFERDHGDNLFVDKSSDKLIVSSTIRPGSRYLSIDRQSSLSSNESWSEWRSFAYTVSGAQVERGIADGMAKFHEHFANASLRLPTAATDYCVPGFNLELEATPSAGAGLSARQITISRISDTSSGSSDTGPLKHDDEASARTVPTPGGATTVLRNGSLAVSFVSTSPGPVSVSWGNRTVLQSSSGGALSMRWASRGALFGGAKPTASTQANQTDDTAEVVSAGTTPDGGGWRETLQYNAVGVTVLRTWRLDAARLEVVCSVQLVATRPASPIGNPTLLEAWVQARLHDTPDVAGMTERYFAPHPQAQFDIDCCPGCVFEGGVHVAGQPAGLISNVYAPLHTAAAGVYDRSNRWGAATWLSGVGGSYNTWTIASEGTFDVQAASTTYNPRVCAGQWEHFLFRGFTSDASAMAGGFEYRLTMFDGEPLTFLNATANLPSRVDVMKTRAHPDSASNLPAGNAIVMFPCLLRNILQQSECHTQRVVRLV